MVAGRVLFVEDEDSICEPFSELLRAEGFERVIARTAADALALAEQIQPDVVLGLELGRGRLRRQAVQCGRGVATVEASGRHLAEARGTVPRPGGQATIGSDYEGACPRMRR